MFFNNILSIFIT